jgi:hypothetical protein
MERGGEGGGRGELGGEEWRKGLLALAVDTDGRFEDRAV